MIHFDSDYPAFLPKERIKIRTWLKTVAALYGYTCRAITYRFVTDEELLEVNKTYLQHEEYTDIITFDTRQEAGIGPIEADILISSERVQDNAKTLGTPPQEELRRVIVHGLLHLCGLADKTPAQQKAMRQAEDQALAKWS
jgi:probable rRNA maturation factor